MCVRVDDMILDKHDVDVMRVDCTLDNEWIQIEGERDDMGAMGASA